MALRLGRTVQELLASLTLDELRDWLAYYELEPWDDQRADLRAGIIAATLCNLHAGRGGRTFRPADFMPYLRQSAEGDGDGDESDYSDLDKHILAAFGLSRAPGGNETP